MGGTPPAHRSPAAITPAASLRQLIDSLNREQRRNQELLASLGFALRSFTNLSRFLELVPLLTARLVEAEGAVLLTFRSDGGLWREQLHCSSQSRCGELLRQLAGLQDSDLDRDAAHRRILLVRQQFQPVVQSTNGAEHVMAKAGAEQGSEIEGGSHSEIGQSTLTIRVTKLTLGQLGVFGINYGLSEAYRRSVRLTPSRPVV